MSALCCFAFALSANAQFQFQQYSGSWDVLPDFSALTPVRGGSTNTISVGVSTVGDNFGLVFTRDITVSVGGDYFFQTTSDDGSKLYINGTEVVNNDGLHGAQTVTSSIFLSPGTYALRIEFFEKGGGQIIDAAYRIQNGTYAPIPANGQLSGETLSAADAGQWSPVIPWPHIAISAATLPDGRILSWSSTEVNAFPSNREYTHASVFDPATETFINTDSNFHDMFCAGVSLREDGGVVASGGNPDDSRTSLFDPQTLSWSPLNDMNDRRWYGTNVTLPGNTIFSTFAKSAGNRSEVLNVETGEWTRTPNASMQTLVDEQNAINSAPAGSSGSTMQWFAHLAVMPNGRVFHGGPGQTFHTFDPVGGGANDVLGQPVGDRARMWGNAVTYDEGKVLMVGGGDRRRGEPTSVEDVYLVDLNGAAPSITQGPPMNYPRALSNSITLPNGEVLVIGGNTTAQLFSDGGSIYATEIYTPQTNSWRVTAPIDIPRNYHSTALLLKDGRVLSAGGGGCGTCSASHLDGQIFSPPYLFDAQGNAASRPQLTSAPATVSAGQTVTVNASDDTARFSMVRLSATTHHMNTDQRYLPVAAAAAGAGAFNLTFNGNPNVLVPGYYWLFAVNAQGTPSIGRTIQVLRNTAPLIDTDGDGVSDADDAFPLDPFETADADNDGIGNNADQYPNDPTRVSDPVFDYQVYDGNWDALPDFGALTPESSGQSTVIGLSVTGQVDTFGLVFTKVINIPVAGEYGFSTTSDDGTKLYVDGQLVVNNDGLHGAVTQSGSVSLSAGLHTLRVEFFEKFGGQVLSVAYQAPDESAAPIPADGVLGTIETPPPPPPMGDGFNYWVYEGDWDLLPNFESLTPVATGNADAISLDVTTETQTFGLVFERELTVLASDIYTFTTTSDDGTKLYIDGQLVVNNDGLHPAVTRSGDINLTAGSHLLRVEFFEKYGGEVLSVSYQAPGETAAPIPADGVIGTAPPEGFAYEVFDGNWNLLPDFTTLTPEASGSSDAISLAVTAQTDTFGLVFTNTLNVPTAATYEFRTVSDDGTKLFIDGDLIVNNDGLHGARARSGLVTLNAGTHDLRVEFFEKLGGQVLTVDYRPEAGTFAAIPADGMLAAGAVAVTPLPMMPRHSSTISVESSTSVDRVWNVNPDNDSVSVMSADGALLAQIPVGERPWSIAQRPGTNQMFVTNKGSATISVIDTGTLAVVSTVSLPRASQPHGVVFNASGSDYYVALEASGLVQRRSASTQALVASAEVGGTPRHLSMRYDDAGLLVSNFITPPLAGEDSASVDVASGRAEVFVLEPASLALSGTIGLTHDGRALTESGGPGMPNYLQAPVVSYDNSAAYVPSKKDNVASGAMRGIPGMTFESAVRANTSRILLASQSEDTSFRVDFDNSSVAAGGALSGDGQYLLVALETSRQLAVYDTQNNFELMRLPTGRAPQGVVISSDGRRAFVHNFMDRSVTRFDLTEMLQTDLPASNVLGTTTVVTSEALDSDVLIGKQLFYDAQDDRLARDDYMSCASCHNDGGTDGRVWDLGAFGEGIRLTQALRGRGLQHGLLHWTGNFDEVQDFEGQIRSLAGGTGLMSDADFASTFEPLGAPKAGLAADLDALAVYVNSLVEIAPSPYRAANGTLSAQAEAGREVFADRGCATCHAGPTATDSDTGALHDIGTITAASGARAGEVLTGLDTPTLLGLWEDAPYLHNGSAPTIAAAIAAHDGVALSTSETNAVAAFLRELDSADLPPSGPAACTSPDNIAPDGTATQSSGYGANRFPAPLAIDLDLNNFTHTGSKDSSSSWQLAFADLRVLETIVLYNRAACCGSRLRDINVQVFAGDTEVFASALLNPENVLNSPASIVVDLSAVSGGPIVGDRIVISRVPDFDLSGTGGAGNIDESGVLSLGEVVVEGCAL